jgi:hypothetical protein
MAHDERRRSTRVLFRTTASLVFGDKSYLNHATADLSVKGVFVLGIEGYHPGDKCDVELRLSGVSDELVLSMQGEVVRVQKEGIAVKFCEIDLDSFYHLKNIVYYNSENPDELTGELDPVFVVEGAEENESQDHFD